METIEEAARDYAYSFEDNDYTIETEFAFKAGVNFSQRWIDSKEELPTKEGKYLVMRDGRVDIEIWVESGYWYDYIGITHWRPIELK